MLAIVCLLPPVVSGLDLITLHVAVDGDDAADGLTISTAKRTLEAARVKLRALRPVTTGSARVLIHPGTYDLAGPLRLEAADGGGPDATVSWEGVGDGAVILRGLAPVQGFGPPDAVGIVEADLADLHLPVAGDPGTGGTAERCHGRFPLFRLVSGDRALPMSRWPKEDHQRDYVKRWAYTGVMPEAEMGDRTKLRLVTDRWQRWGSPTCGFVHAWTQFDWFDEILPIAGVEPKLLRLGCRAGYDCCSGRRYAVLNLREEIDTPGEWSYDANTRRLSMMSLPGQQVLYTRARTLVALVQTHGVTVKGLRLSGCWGEAITITGGSDCRIEGLVITCADRGVVIRDGTGHVITGCNISGMAGTGVQIDGGERKRLVPAGHRVEGNDISACGQRVVCYQALVVAHGVGLTIARNRLHDHGHNAILYGGNDILIQGNHIFDVCRDSSDAGAIYSGRAWTHLGNRIIGNLIHDVVGWGIISRDHRIANGDRASGPAADGRVTYATGDAVHGIYLDDLEGWTEVAGNLLLRIRTTGAIHVGGGNGNRITGNWFIDVNVALKLSNRKVNTRAVEAERATVPFADEPWSSRFPFLAALPGPRPGMPTDNVVTGNWFAGGKTQVFQMDGSIRRQDLVWSGNRYSGTSEPVFLVTLEDALTGKVRLLSWAQWQANGFDAGSDLVEGTQALAAVRELRQPPVRVAPQDIDLSLIGPTIGGAIPPLPAEWLRTPTVRKLVEIDVSGGKVAP